jgi:hypothetical protein
MDNTYKFNNILYTAKSNTKKIMPYILPSLLSMAEAKPPSNITAPYQDPALSTEAVFGYLSVLGGFMCVCGICLYDKYCTCTQCFSDEEAPKSTISDIGNVTNIDTFELEDCPSKFMIIPIGELPKLDSQPSLTIDTHTDTPGNITSTESPKSGRQLKNSTIDNEYLRTSGNISTNALESPHVITKNLNISHMEKIPVTDLPYDIGEILKNIYGQPEDYSDSNNQCDFDTRYAYGNLSQWATYQELPAKTITLSLLHYNNYMPKKIARNILYYVSRIDKSVNHYCESNRLQLVDTHIEFSVPVSTFFWVDTLSKKKLEKLDA